MSDGKNCSTCRHEALNGHEQPCVSCTGDYSNWEAKRNGFKASAPIAAGNVNWGYSPDEQRRVVAYKVVGKAAPAPADSALAVQEGGDHYKTLPIQPVEYIHKNGIGYFEGNVIKYVSRWRSKGGVADLKKAKHYIELLMELEGAK